MTLRVPDVALPAGREPGDLAALAARALGVPPARVRACRLARRALDTRRHGRPLLVLGLEAELEGEEDFAALRLPEPGPPFDPAPAAFGPERLPEPPLVVGAGPAGLFAALLLARWGYRPLVVERGPPLAERRQAVARFHARRELDPEANYLFGEGGAGAFSDGKLYSSRRGPLADFVRRELVAAGAPLAILADARPHLGSDRLGAVVCGLRANILAAGGTLRCGCRVAGFAAAAGRLAGLRLAGELLPARAAVLAPGGHARDTFAALRQAGLPLAAKPFQLGLRVEHPRELVDRAVYGAAAGRAGLPAAEYRLVHRGPRPVCSFCMCPGGRIVPAASAPGEVVTNGMSDAARDAPWSSAGLVATFAPEDWGGEALAGLEFQARGERLAFALGGGDFAAPAQRADHFLAGRLSAPGDLPASSYPFGLRPADLAALLPPALAPRLRAALAHFDRRLPGFAGPAGVLVGIESRASCPVRLPRHPETLEYEGLAGIFPAGEGAGYAGGILSAALDGARAARALAARFAPA